jgi:hypothetical protein
MLRIRGRTLAGMALVTILMGFDAILHPNGARMEDIRDETRRKKDAQSGEPAGTEEERDRGPASNGE